MSARFAVRYWKRNAGHDCTDDCSDRDLLDCYHEVEHRLRSKKIEAARGEAAKVCARLLQADGNPNGFYLAQLLTPAEELSCADEWRESVEGTS